MSHFRRLIRVASSSAESELCALRGRRAERLTVFVGVDGDGVFFGGEVVPVGAVGGEFGVDTFFEDVTVEEEGFAGLFSGQIMYGDMGVWRGDEGVPLCSASARIPKDSGYPAQTSDGTPRQGNTTADGRSPARTRLAPRQPCSAT